jgi:hypothetical protein
MKFEIDTFLCKNFESKGNKILPGTQITKLITVRIGKETVTVTMKLIAEFSYFLAVIIFFHFDSLFTTVPTQARQKRVNLTLSDKWSRR